MRISSAFPSKYLKASDIPEGSCITVTISHVEIEDVGGGGSDDDHKPVLYFQGKQKGMVMNRTNAGIISGKFGDDTDEWVGQKIGLYATETQFQAKMVPCLRVRILKNVPVSPPSAAAAPVVAKPVSPISEEPVHAEDDIPF